MSRTPAQIEAAAKAICREWGYLWDGDEDDDQTAPEIAGVYDERPDKRLYRRAAEAALKAADGLKP